MENANKRRRIFRSLSKLECSRKEINFREIRLHFTLSANWNKRDKDWKKNTPIQFKRDVLAAIAVVHARTPHYHPPTENKWLRASLNEKTRTSASFIRMTSRFRIAFRWWLGHFKSKVWNEMIACATSSSLTADRFHTETSGSFAFTWYRCKISYRSGILHLVPKPRWTHTDVTRAGMTFCGGIM